MNLGIYICPMRPSPKTNNSKTNYIQNFLLISISLNVYLLRTLSTSVTLLMKF